MDLELELEDQFQQLWNEYQELDKQQKQGQTLVQLPGRLWLPAGLSQTGLNPVQVSDANACQALCSETKCGAATFNQVTKYCWTYAETMTDGSLQGTLQVDDDSTAIVSRQSQLLQQMKQLNRELVEKVEKEKQQISEKGNKEYEGDVQMVHARLLAREKKVRKQGKQLDELSTNLELQQTFVHQMASRYQLWLFICCVLGLAFKEFKPISVILLTLITATFLLGHGSILVVLCLAYWIL